MIKPTIGRIVWYRLKFYPEMDAPILAAIVTHVYDDGKVNLAVFNMGGDHIPTRNVTLRQEGDPEPDHSYCEWMPCQIGQAKKPEEK